MRIDMKKYTTNVSSALSSNQVAGSGLLGLDIDGS